MSRWPLPDGEDDLGIGDDAYDQPTALELRAERVHELTTHADHRQD